MIKFRSKEIPGYHETLVASSPSGVAKRSTFTGLNGATEIILARGGRTIESYIWLTKKDWTGSQPKQLLKELDRLDKEVNEHGVLEETDARDVSGVKRKFKNCTFLGFTPIPLAGQRTPAPLKDEGGTLHGYSDFSKSGGAWFIAGVLRWFQPQVD